MFERYTEAARRSIFFARYMAAQHAMPYVETPCLLLAVLHEDRERMAQLLPEGLQELARLSAEVEATLPQPAQPVQKIAAHTDLPLSHACKRALAYGAEEGERLGHKPIDCRHLLCGLLREKGPELASLQAHGVELEAVRLNLLQDAALTAQINRKPLHNLVDRPPTDRQQEWLAAARAAIEIEAASLLFAAERLDDSLIRAVDLILRQPGKVVVTGIGKSGHVARTIVATLCSTGTAAVFLHPAEAVHGDLGIYTPGDPTILISKNGSSAEMLALVPLLRDFHSPLIGILGSAASPLAARMDVLLDASVEREADPHNLAPTASAVTALAIGHALAIALMCGRGFTPEEFGRFHPGGQLGRNLRLSVRQAMHPIGAVASVAPETPLKEVIIAMTRRPWGAACVVASDGTLAGLITDGDLRRALTNYDDVRGLRAEQAMTPHPVTIGAETTLGEALERMERRQSQISVLPVVDDAGRALGLLRLHDIYLGP
jgi:arabinose-5-phosphate isomerase